MAAISLFIATVGILQALAVSVTETRVPGGVQEANVVDASMGDALASQVEVRRKTHRHCKNARCCAHNHPGYAAMLMYSHCISGPEYNVSHGIPRRPRSPWLQPHGHVGMAP